MPLHTAVSALESQTSWEMRVITVVAIPCPALQRRIEQSGTLAVGARVTL